MPRRRRSSTAALPPSAPLDGAPAQPYPTPLAHLQDIRSLLRHRARAARFQEMADGNGGYSRIKEPSDPAAAAADARNEAELLRNCIAAREAANRTQGPALPIDTLTERMGLSAFERTVLLLSALPALDLSAEDDFGALHDGLGSSLTVMGVFMFAEFSLEDQLNQRRRFRADAPLRARDLITLSLPSRAATPMDLLRADISITPHTLSAILGDDGLSDELAELSSIEAPLATFAQVVLPAADRERILAVVDSHGAWAATRAAWGLDRTVRYGRGTFILFSGPPGTGKTLTAHAIADRLGKRVLSVDIPSLVQHMDNGRILPGIFREARLRDAVLFFDECETLFADRSKGNALMTILLTEMERFEGLAVLATNLPALLDEAMFRRLLVHIRFEAPDAAAREAIWRAVLPPEAPLAPDVDVPLLARRYGLSGGELKNAALNACARAFARSGVAGPITQADLEAAARDQLRHPAADNAPAQARWSEVTLADVHLPADLLAELRPFLAIATHSRMVRGEWGVARRDANADVALFHGPPGTGKTLCARAIAGELGKPLLSVSLGHLRSKYVGESEANLAAVFRRAAAEEAVLLFDEVDALLPARGSARAAHHDDVLTSTLLTLLDGHRGVVIFTSNRPQALDGALARRIGWHIAFPLPDAAARAAIWRSVLPASAPLHPALDFDRLGARLALAGGDIRTVAIRAAAVAAAEGRVIDQSLLETLAATLQATPTAGRHLALPVGNA